MRVTMTRCRVAAVVAAALVAGGGPWRAGAGSSPTNSAPNPYQTIEGWAKMPAGRTWGATSAVDIDKDGKSIWVAERCGANRCVNQQTGEVSPLDVVLKFDATGTLVKSFGAGMFVFPHGIHVDRDGNIWVTDGQDNFPTRGAQRGAPTRRCRRRRPSRSAIRSSSSVRTASC